MNIDNLFSYINSKKAFDEDAIKEIMLVIEKYPYFQIAHMILLKAIQHVQPDKYNNQLKISGSFISDKRKLFQFINTDIDLSKTSTKEIKTETPEKTKTIEKEPIREIKAKTKEPIIKKEVETESQIKTKETDTEKKSSRLEKLRQKEKVRESQVKKNVDLSENEIERLTNENSQKKHHEIITDFFNDKDKKHEGNIRVTPKIEKKTKEPIGKKTVEEVKTPIKEIVPEKKKEETKSVKEEKKESFDVKKIIEQVNSGSIKEKKPVREIQVEKKKKETEVEKPINKAETEVKVERSAFDKIREQTKAIKKDVTEPKKETGIKNAESVGQKSSEKDAMSNIFSKIKQIKQEMNINSETSSPKTIDIGAQTKNEKTPVQKTAEPKNKRTGRVIKESFIGFDEETTSNEKKENVERKETVEKKAEQNEIKQSELTAKDLFKRHKLKKEEPVEQIEKKEVAKVKTTSPISKLVEIVNTDEVETSSPEVVKTKEIVKEVKKEETPYVKKQTSSGEGAGDSAADLLLKRIAAKKQRMKQEKENEERLKELERQKEMDAVNALIKGEKKTEEPEEKMESVGLETAEKEEAPVEENLIKENVEPVIEKEEKVEPTIPVKEKKSNKLIDSFIEKADSLERLGSKESSLTGDISEQSTNESEEIMTETYADLLIQQKKYTKAVDVYKKLILKFPEKKTYFAIQIKKVESLIK